MTADLVSSTIAARAREPEGLRKMMLAASAAAHVVAIALIVLLPGLVGIDSQAPDTVMTISLGGAPGPVSGGMTPISSRPVQKAEPLPELPRPTPVRPPAPKPPEMVEPTKAPLRTPPKPVRQAPEQSTARTPTTGAQEKPGQGRTETGSQSTEAGLSTGGGGGTGGQINLGDFCDPQYLGQMISLIHRNWNPSQTVAGKPIVRFVIQRDGTLTDISLRQSSGYGILDLVATRAVTQTRAIPPLPACYPNPTFIVNLTFEYIR